MNVDINFKRSNKWQQKVEKEKYKNEIENLILKGVSIRSAWRLINADLPEEGKISYNAFYHFVRNAIN